MNDFLANSSRIPSTPQTDRTLITKVQFLQQRERLINSLSREEEAQHFLAEAAAAFHLNGFVNKYHVR